MKITVLDGYTLNPGDLSWEELEKFGEVSIYDRTPKNEVISRIGDSQIVFTNKTVIDRDVIEKCKNIKYIGVLATGYNVIDIEYAHKKGIIVTNIPSYGTDSVAQFTIAMLLELCHHIGLHSESVFSGEWTKCPDWCYWKTPLIELSGKTLGIIGYGRIGRQTGEIAKTLGMKVLAFDKNQISNDTTEYVGLDELLKRSDVITLHCPLLPETKEIINSANISKMKSGVMILNAARGELINENDLAEALKKGKVGGAAVDVVSKEPIDKDNPLLSAPNMIITPHMAWGPKESRERLLNQAICNFKSYLEGKVINAV